MLNNKHKNDSSGTSLDKFLLALRKLVGDFPPLILSLKMLLQGNTITEADNARICQGLKKTADIILMKINKETIDNSKIFEHFRFVLQ